MRVLNNDKHHLTAHDKKALTYMHANDMRYGTTKFKKYLITADSPNDGIYTVEIWHKYTATAGRSPEWHKSTIQYQL